MRKNVGILVTLAVLVVSGVVGCAARPPEAEPTPTATVEPTPTLEPIANPAWPVQLVPTTCEQIVSQSAIDAVFDEPLLAGYQPTEFGQGGLGRAAAENSGSLLCIWGAGEGDERRVLIVNVVPRAVAIDERRSVELGGTPMGAPIGSCDAEICAVRGIVGEYWMEATIFGADTMGAEGAPPAAQPVFDSVIAAVTALAPSVDPVWPASAESWPTSCEEFVSPETVGEALNVPGATFTTGFYYSPSNVELGEIVSARGLVCGIAPEGGGRSGRILTLPESGDRFAAARDQAVLSDTVEAVEIAGLESGSAFMTRHPETPASASLEMNLRGTWVLLSMSTGTVEQGDSAALLLNLATALAED